MFTMRFSCPKIAGIAGVTSDCGAFRIKDLKICLNGPPPLKARAIQTLLSS